MSDKARILVVDDELGVREALRVILEPHYEVAAVESGEAALRALPTFQPDLVFLDIRMPTMDGVEALRRLKATDARIEVVMVTAYASYETLRESLTDGAFQYLVKPFSRGDVEATAHRALARARGRRGAEGPPGDPPAVRIGLVGGGKGGSNLLDLLLDWPAAKVVVVVDRRPDAPALAKAQALGIPTVADHLEVFAYPVDLVLEVTGQPAVLDDLLRTKPPGVEVIGAGSLRFFWNLLQDKITTTRQLRAQLDMAVALESPLNLRQQVVILARKLAQACGVDRCSVFFWNEATGLVTPVVSQFATGEGNTRMWTAFKRLRGVKLADVPFLYEVIERRGPIEIDDPASSPLVPRGWTARFELKALLVVPILRRNRVVGACVLDQWREARHFTPDQKLLASALASQVALALENAQLYQDVADKAKRLASLLESTKRTAAMKDSRRLLSWIAQEAATFLRAEGAGIRIREGEELVYGGHFGYAWEGLRDRVRLGESGSGRAVVDKGPVAITDIEGDPRILRDHRQAYRRAGFRSMLAVPMRVGEQVIGALFVLRKRQGPFSTSDIDVLAGFADQAALAIENTRLYEETERRRRAAESLAELGRRLSQSLDPQEVEQRIADSVRMLLGAKASVLFRLEPESGDLVAMAVSGDIGPTGRPTLVLPQGTGLAALAVSERRSVTSPDVLTDPRVVLAAEARARIEATGHHAVLCMPLLVQDTMIGVLSVRDETGRAFDEETVRLAETFVHQAVIALENARLYAEVARSAAERQALLEVSAQVGSTLKVERLLDVILERACALLGIPAAGIFKADLDSGFLVYERGAGLSPEFVRRLRVRLGEGTSGQAMERRAPAWSSDLLNDLAVTLSEESRALVAREGYRAVLSVPILTKDNPFGVLAAYWWEAHRPTASEVRLLSALAGQAGLALENSRLYEELQESYEELTRTQDLLVQSQKMEAIGRLAGGVAHDFNNLLMIISGRSQLLLRRLPSDNPLRRDVGLIDATATRAADVIRQLLAFGRKQVLQPKVLDLNAVVDDLAPMLRRLIGEDNELVVVLDPTLGRVKADPGQLGQVILNLAVNAQDAMPQGGHLVLETAHVTLDAIAASRHLGVPPGAYVMLAVRDTGCGMDPETQQHIFEPFFTTKGPGQGTGLGLATVYGIITQSGGHISVDSDLGKGTTFTIYLPQVDDAVEAMESGTALPEAPQGSETILLVEDEDGVREVARDALEIQGYTLLEARHPEEALQLAVQHPGPIHLLLTDVVMPQLNGRQLVDRLAPRRPEMKVLYMSGYTDTAIVHHGVLEPGTAYLQKPFTPDSLAREVRKVLDAPSQPR